MIFEEISKRISLATKKERLSNELKRGSVRVHIAIMIEPYLEYILEGSKTIETRFSKVKCSPYKKVQEGDYILFKRSGGKVVAVSKVSSVSYYEINETGIDFIKEKFGKAICPANKSFWKERSKARYATLISIDKPETLKPFEVKKRDRRGWVTLEHNSPFKVVD